MSGSRTEAAAPVAASPTAALQRSRHGALLQAGAALLWIVQAALLALAIGRLADGAGWQAVPLPALGFVLLGMLRASLEACGARLLFGAARSRVADLRRDAVAALACRSPFDSTRPASGQAAAALAEQAEAVLPALMRYQVARWRVVLVMPVIVLVVLPLSWIAALILLFAAPLIPLFMMVIGWRAKAASEAQLQLVGGMGGFLLDRLRGLSTLRALGAVELTAVRLRATAEAVRASTMRVLRIAFLSSTALELFASLAVALVAVYIGFHLLGQIDGGSWGQRLSLSQGMFILLLAPAFFEPLRELAAVWHDKAAGDAALSTLAALQRDAVLMPGALGDAAIALAAPGALGIELQDLHFGHAGQTPLFDGLNLQIRAGERVALVGASGSGKTSLLALIAGLLPASSGSVQIGGVALDERSGAALRRRMAWIAQKPHVFAASVRSNVSLGRPGVTNAAVSAALARAGLQEEQYAGLAARLGEGGSGLSGGECVRLALARAAVDPDASVLLADEPSAHLDVNTAAAVIDALFTLAQGRTLIVATHDLTLAARFDRVIDVTALVAQREAA